jgi:hypothetical protein
VRAALLALLLLNLAYFGYTRLASDTGELAASAEAGAPVPRLVLVGAGGPTPPACSTVGPFVAQAAAQRAAAWLLSGHHGSRLHSADAPGASSYWVAIITKTMQDATKTGLRLRAAGVQDLVIMPPEAGATNAIVSLGIYSDRERADHRVTDLRRYAVTPTVIEQPHTVTTWWLDVQTAAGESMPDVNAIAKAGGEAGSLRASACALTPAPASTPTAIPPGPPPSVAPATTPPAAPPVASVAPGDSQSPPAAPSAPPATPATTPATAAPKPAPRK